MEVRVWWSRIALEKILLGQGVVGTARGRDERDVGARFRVNWQGRVVARLLATETTHSFAEAPVPQGGTQRTKGSCVPAREAASVERAGGPRGYGGTQQILHGLL